MKLTLTRALSELKLLQKRYEKEVYALNLIAVKQGSKLRRPNSGIGLNDFEQSAVSSLQSVKSLYERIILIKTKIDEANATTVVNVAGKDMTIQQAIVEKKYILLKEELLEKLRGLKSSVNHDLEKADSEVRSSAESLRNSLAQSGNKKNEDIDDMVNKLIKSEEASLVDPCSLDKEITTLERYIEDFKSNVDFALSEVNSKTEIEIPQ